MLRRCEKDWLLFVNGFKKVNCFGGGPRSDRSACVEKKRERESMLDSQKRTGRSNTGGASLGLYGYRLLPDSRFSFGSLFFRHRSAEAAMAAKTKLRKWSEIFPAPRTSDYK